MPGSSQLRYAAAYVAITTVILFFLNIYAANTTRSLIFSAQHRSLEEKAQLMTTALLQLDELTQTKTAQAVNSLDDLRTALPNTAFYVQSVLPATQEKVADSLPGLAPDRLAVINAAIQQLCAERGCYYLDLSAEFADDAGYLSTEFSQPDGVHLTVSGYSRWVSYLCTHVPYSKDNPYQAGSTYYLNEDMKGLLSDLP